MIFCVCGCPCCALFVSEIVLWFVSAAFSATGIFGRGIDVGKIFWQFSGSISGFWWRHAWVRVVLWIWLGTLASTGYVCGWSSVEKLLVGKGGLPFFLMAVDHVVEGRVEEAEEADLWKGNEDVHV